MSIEQQLDIWTRWIIQTALIGWNWVTESWDNSMEYCIRILTSLEHAHVKDEWIFINPNEIPYIAKEGKHSTRFEPTMVCYYPETHTFCYKERINGRAQRFDAIEVVLERIGQDDIDLADFFNQVTWKQFAIPSLYEVVMMYFLEQKTPISHYALERMMLRVVDSSMDEHRIPLNSNTATRRFTGWV